MSTPAKSLTNAEKKKIENDLRKKMNKELEEGEELDEDDLKRRLKEQIALEESSGSAKPKPKPKPKPQPPKKNVVVPSNATADDVIDTGETEDEDKQKKDPQKDGSSKDKPDKSEKPDKSIKPDKSVKPNNSSTGTSVVGAPSGQTQTGQKCLPNIFDNGIFFNPWFWVVVVCVIIFIGLAVARRKVKNEFEII